MTYDVNCVHDWQKTRETDDRGVNLLGKEVQCYGWDLFCDRCGSTSWRRDNERTEQEENDRLWSKVL